MRQQYLTFASILIVLLLMASGVIAAAKFWHTSSSQPASSSNPSSLLQLPAQSSGGLSLAQGAAQQQTATQNQPVVPAATEIDASDSADPQNAQKVLVTLTNGQTFTIAVYEDLAPKTVANFLNKVSSGFYNGLLFFRVDKDQQGNVQVVQTGDPTNTGQGGKIMQAEYNKRPFKAGSVGIARGQNRDQNSDSQFFIAGQDLPQLTDEYTNFGDVIDGMNVVQQLHQGQPIKSIQVIQQ